MPYFHSRRSRHRSHRSAHATVLTLACLSLLMPASAAHAQSSTLSATSQSSAGSKGAPASSANTSANTSTTPQAQPQPPRAVVLVTARTEMWPDEVEVYGNIMPWQETHIGTEIGGLRLISVRANVGDVVKKGQVLAQLNPTSVEAELEATNAQLMEAQAALAQADATLTRAKRLAPSGGVSQQEMTLYETQKQTAEARLNATRARVKTQELKLESTTLVAPDDGVISSRSASEGAIIQAGSELFRLIRYGRLEWRAEVKADVLLQLSPGQEITLDSPLGDSVKGRVRQIAPTIDLTTRTGLVYVDLPANTHFKAGFQASGTLALKRKALNLPASAVRHDEKGDQVFTVNAANKVEANKVQLGRTVDSRIEIVSGLNGRTGVIARDVEALKAGDTVIVGKAP
ncbi:MAG TPA: efflux RND transporter periplasmic adaptor subunit [Rhodocyclaceae bacterium]|nr:efflux RND transporter periplasmic adaptor subunit [Rhodocyclaceae bacterium]